MSNEGWMDKENMTCIYKWILLRIKKEGSLAIYDNMDGPSGHYAKWKKVGWERHLYDFTYMWNLNKNNAKSKPN